MNQRRNRDVFLPFNSVERLHSQVLAFRVKIVTRVTTIDFNLCRWNLFISTAIDTVECTRCKSFLETFYETLDDGT